MEILYPIENDKRKGNNQLNSPMTRKIKSKLGLTNSSNMYWWHNRAVGINFGDWIGPYIYNQKNGKYPTNTTPNKSPLETSYYTVGSIIHLIKRKNTAIIWGSGAISSDINFPMPRKICAVRGPLTRKICLQLNYECPKVYGDPGLLMPNYFRPKKSEVEERIGLVPHYSDFEIAKRLYGNRKEILIIDVKQDVETVITEICKCKALVSTSLHGLIMGHAYRIPTVWGLLENRLAGGRFKFDDYHLGAGFSVCPNPLNLLSKIPTSEIEKEANKAERFEDNDITRKLEESCPF